MWRLGQAEWRATTLRESIASMAFDVAMLAAAAPSTSLSVRWTWGVRYVALKRESHPFKAPRPLGKPSLPSPPYPPCFSSSLSLPCLVSTSVFHTRSPTRSAKVPMLLTPTSAPPLIPASTPTTVFSILTLCYAMSPNETYTATPSSLQSIYNAVETLAIFFSNRSVHIKYKPRTFRGVVLHNRTCFAQIFLRNLINHFCAIWHTYIHRTNWKIQFSYWFSSFF